MVVNAIKTRTFEIDILKGIAIILMVYGHTFAVGHDFIYQFHMSVFIMASGYFSKRNITDLYDLKTSIAKKVKSLYAPYLICNITSLALTDCFLALNCYSNNPDFLAMTGNSIVKQVLTEPMSLIQFVKQSLKIVIGIGSTQLTNPTWFLFVLFAVIVLNDSFVFLIGKFKNQNVRIALHCFVFIMFCFLLQKFEMISEAKRIFAAYLVYQLGVFVWVIKKFSKYIYNVFTLAISFAGLLIISQEKTIELGGGRIVSPAYFVIVSMLGWVFLMSMSMILSRQSNVLKKQLIYIGQHTMPILILHLLSFKIVNALYVAIHGLPAYMIASFHVIFNTSYLFVILYTIVGVCVPLALSYLYQKVRNGVRNRY